MLSAAELRVAKLVFQMLALFEACEAIIKTRMRGEVIAERDVVRLKNLMGEIKSDKDFQADAQPAFIQQGADKLAIAVLEAIDRGNIETRTTISDALEAYAAVRFNTMSSNEIELLREYRDKVKAD